MFLVIQFLAEFIVSFKGYYSEEAREGFLSAALKSSSCRQWHTIRRSNPSQNYPSDFSVVHLMNKNNSDCVLSLKSHPSVKMITPHRKFSRSLSCAQSADSVVRRRSMLEQPSSGDKWIVGRRLLRAIPRQITSALHADVLWTLGYTGKGVKVRMAYCSQSL